MLSVLTCLFYLLSPVFGWLAVFRVVLADGLPGRFALVLRACGAAGAGRAGFRDAGGRAQRFADAAESGADPAGSHHPSPAGAGLGSLPGQAGARARHSWT